MNKNRRLKHGFTLVELLIALALLGIILTAVVSVNIGTARAAAALQARNDLQPELQLTQNYMAGKLREAAYIFPVGANIQMSVSAATTAKPDGTQNWVVGDTAAPIMAFVVPPKTVGGTPLTNCAAAASHCEIADRCYAFYAFYPMKRDAYLAAVTGADDPGANSLNDSTAWVLMEYRGYYSSAALNTNLGFLASSAPSTSIPIVPKAPTVPTATDNVGRLLMDYLFPTDATTPLFTEANAPAAALSQSPGVTTVAMNLAASQNVVGQIVRVPAASTFSSLTVYPRNVGKPQLSN